MKKFKRFFASILCVCMILTSCPDILAWAAGDTAFVKTTKFEFSAKKLSKMVQKADKDNTDDNGLCKLSVPKAMNYGKQLKLRAYLQADEENIVFLFVNKTKKRHAAAIIVDDMMSDIIAVSTKQELLDEEYATDSNSDYDYDVYTDGLLDADFMDMAAEVLDGTANPSDNDADKEYDHLDGDAFDVILRDGTVGAALVVSLEALGLDDMGELLPDEEEDEERSVVIASDSNAGSAVVLPGKDDTAVVLPGADTPVVLPDQEQRPVVVDLPVETPSNSGVVTVATPSNVAKTFIQELNGVKIKAHAEAGVIPDEATFEAIELKETGDTADAYKEACETLDADEETQYDGVMAYDLHFLLHGEEIQPDGEVQISMEVSKEALPEEADPNTIEVKHLAEEDDSLQVQTVADTEDKVEGTVKVKDTAITSESGGKVESKAAQNATAVTAEFKVDSFSYFTITFKKRNTIKAYIVNSKGESITLVGEDADGKVSIGGTQLAEDNFDQVIFDPTDFGARWEEDYNNNGYGKDPNGWGSDARQDKWISIKTVADSYGRYTKGYTYSKAQINQPGENVTAQEIKWIYYRKWNNTWYYSNAGTKPTSFNVDDTDTHVLSLSGSTDSQIYLVYDATNVNREINDEIATTGHLTITYTGEQDKKLTFKWYGSDDDITWSQITPRRVQGNNTNIVTTDDGHSSYLYPALDLSDNLKTDKTIRRWYKAEVWDGNTKLGEYKKYQVPYFAAIQNGSFEDVKIDGNEGVNPTVDTSGIVGNFTFSNGHTGLIWQTTGADEQIEIADVNHEGLKRYNCGEAVDGTQFAELNAERAGALYQVVLTQPGSELNWEFYHKGRYGLDTMYMVIASANELDTITNQIATGQTPNVSGSRYLQVDSKTRAGWYYDPYQHQKYYDEGPGDWFRHSSDTVGEGGTYKVPAGQYLTVFFFVAKSTSTGSTTQGNLLDNVSFGTQPLIPNNGTGTLQVTKSVEGISEDDIGNYRVKINLYNSNSEVVRTNYITFATGQMTNTIEFTNLVPDTYEVEEIPEFIGTTGNSYNLVESKLQLDTTSTTIEPNTRSSIGMIEENKIKSIRFTNKYTPQYISLTVEKMVKGNMGSNSDVFSFIIDAGKDANQIQGEYSVVKSDGSTETQTIESDGVFHLRGGEKITIDKIPHGATISVSETSQDGYKTTYLVDTTTGTGTEGRSYTFNNMTANHSILFINTREVIIPTGLFDNGHPTGWLYLMAAAAGCFAFGFYRRRKKKLENGEECL